MSRPTTAALYLPAALLSLCLVLFMTGCGNTSGSASNASGPGTGSGSAPTSGVSYTLSTFPEADHSATLLYNFIAGATQTIDMTMYELQDTTFTSGLTAACGRGVKVRVILSSSVKSNNAPAYAAINSGGGNCTAVYSNTAFTNTHQKTITIDNTQTAIMSLNLQSQYYSTTRDFVVIENDPADLLAIEATFAQDYAAAGTNSSADFNYAPGPGDDLIWSPTTATASMLSIINNATKTIILENEEMSASNIVSALQSACQRGVQVHIAMVANSSYTANFNTLTAAGCGVYLYPNTTTGFYVHAKAVVADYGLPTQNAYMGSINYSTASLTQNRELGLFLTNPTSVTALYNVMTQDYTGNPSF